MNIVKRIFKGAWWLIATIILTLIFVGISFVKITGVIKGLFHPLYTWTTPSLFTVGLLAISLYAFYWFTRRAFVIKRKYLFPTMFGFAVSATLLYQMPIYNLISFTSHAFYSAVIPESKNVAQFEAENIALNNIGFTDMQISPLIENIYVDELSISSLPMYALRAEIESDPSAQLFAENLWKRYYMSLSEIYADEDQMRKAYENAYHSALDIHFKSYDNVSINPTMDESGKRVLLTMANMYKYGIGVEKNLDKSNVIYDMLERNGVVYASYLRDKSKPKDENAKGLQDYFYVKIK